MKITNMFKKQLTDLINIYSIDAQLNIKDSDLSEHLITHLLNLESLLSTETKNVEYIDYKGVKIPDTKETLI